MERHEPPPLPTGFAGSIQSVSPVWRVLMVLCGCATLGIGAFGGYVWFSMQRGANEIDPVVERYFAAIDDGTFTDLYNTSSRTFQETAPVSVWIRFASGIHDGLGKHQGKSLRSFFAHTTRFPYPTTTGERTAEFASADYRVDFEEKTVNVHFFLSKRNGGWGISSVYYDAPTLEVPLKCPYCGTSIVAFHSECLKCEKKWAVGIKD